MRVPLLTLFIAPLSLSVLADKGLIRRQLQDSHDGHDHHDDHGHAHDHGSHESEHAWSWAGVFTLSAGENYTWTAARGKAGTYAAHHLEALILPTSSADLAGLEAVEATAEGLFANKNATEVDPGSAVPVGSLVHLEMNDDSWVSTFGVHVNTSGAYAVLTNHPPAEFENGFHYLKDSHGHDVEPKVEEGGHAEEEVAGVGIGTVVLGALIVALPSLVLIACIAPFVVRLQRMEREKLLMFAFSSGAIFACACFLLLPEAMLLASVGQSEITATWTWGVAILAGWLLCVGIHRLCDALMHNHEGEREVVTVNGAGTDVVMPVDAEEPKKPLAVNYGVAGPVILGDFWHNLVDGMVIGFSGKLCGSAFTWTIIAVTVLHEVPQEIADFVVLVTKANMKWYWAAVTNFVCGLSAVIGAAIAYDADMSEQFQGIALAFGAGVYIFVATTELGPSLLHKGTLLDCLLCCLAFAAGSTCIGLVLLGHEHCATDQGAHAGHNH